MSKSPIERRIVDFVQRMDARLIRIVYNNIRLTEVHSFGSLKMTGAVKFNVEWCGYCAEMPGNHHTHLRLWIGSISDLVLAVDEIPQFIDALDRRLRELESTPSPFNP